MSAALSYESLEDMPEGMRRLVEKQLAKKAERETTQGNVHGGVTTPQSAAAERTTVPKGTSFASQGVAPTALTRVDNGASGTPATTAGTGDSGRNKYGNKPTERILPNGKAINFGSKKEAAYYDSLLIQQRMGLVRNIRLQYQFLLKPAYTDGETGERFRAVSYLADFVFERNEDGQWKRVIVDTKGGKRKGTRTSTYAIKRKLMAEMGYIIEEA